MAVKTPEEFQSVATRVALKARRDRKFANRLKKDPVATLSRMRIGPDAVRELIKEDPGAFGNVKDLGNAAGCTVTCICTGGCCVTKISVGEIFANPDPTMKVNPVREKLLENLIKQGHFKAPR